MKKRKKKKKESETQLERINPVSVTKEAARNYFSDSIIALLGHEAHVYNGGK